MQPGGGALCNSPTVAPKLTPMQLAPCRPGAEPLARQTLWPGETPLPANPRRVPRIRTPPPRPGSPAAEPSESGRMPVRDWSGSAALYAGTPGASAAAGFRRRRISESHRCGRRALIRACRVCAVQRRAARRCSTPRGARPPFPQAPPGPPNASRPAWPRAAAAANDSDPSRRAAAPARHWPGTGGATGPPLPSGAP